MARKKKADEDGDALDADLGAGPATGTDPETQIQQILAELGDKLGSISIFRRGNGRMRYAGRMEADDFSLEGMREQFGGGLFMIRLLDAAGGYLTSKQVELEGPPKVPQAAAPATMGAAPARDPLLETLLVALVKDRQPAADPMQTVTALGQMMQQQMGTLMQTLVPLLGKRGDGMTVDDYRALVDMVREDQADRQPSPVQGLTSMLAKLLDRLPAAGTVPPTTVTPAVREGTTVPAWVKGLAPYITQLVDLARADRNPGVYADVVTDAQPQLASWVAQQWPTPAAAWEAVRGAFPVTEPYAAWFQEFLHALYDDGSDDSGDSGHSGDST